jgi:hypothetical protein
MKYENDHLRIYRLNERLHVHKAQVSQEIYVFAQAAVTMGNPALATQKIYMNFMTPTTNTSKSIKCLLHVMEIVFSKIKLSKLQLQFKRTYFIKGFNESNVQTLGVDFWRPLLFYIT